MPRNTIGRFLVVAMAFCALTLLFPSLGMARTMSDDDVFAFGRNTVLDRAVAGDVVIVSGSVELRAPVHGDVVVLGGNLKIAPGVTVDGDVLVMGGSVVGLTSYNVSGDVYAPGTPARPPEQSGSSLPAAFTRNPAFMTLGVKLILLLFWLIAATLITMFAGKEIRGSSLEIRAVPLQVVTLGLVGFTSFVLSAIVLSYLIPYFVGIPLLVVLGAFAALAKIYGLIAVFHAVGQKLFGTQDREELLRRRVFRGDVAMVISGLIVLGLLHLIPIIGNLIWMMASVTGIGASLSTRFGRREPWFLTARHADA